MTIRSVEAALSDAACKRRRSSGEPRSPTGKGKKSRALTAISAGEGKDNRDFKAVLAGEIARLG